MNTVDKLLFYLFILSLFAMGLIFYVGLQADAGSVLGGLQGLWNGAMGRVNGRFGYANNNN